MMTNLFVSRDCISLLERTGQIRREGSLLTILPDQTVFLLVPACRFFGASAGGDAWRLEGRVLTLAEIERLHGRLLAGAAYVGESTYDVQEGFVGEVRTGDGQATAARSGEPPALVQSAEASAWMEAMLASVAEHEPLEQVTTAAVENDPTPLPLSADARRPTLLPEPTRGEPPATWPEAPPTTAEAGIATSSAGPPPVGAAGEDPSDEDLLVRFLLENP